MLALISFCDLQAADYQVYRIGQGKTGQYDIAAEDVVGAGAEVLWKAIEEASVIACDLNASCRVSLRLLSIAAEGRSLTSPKAFIALSNPLVWSRTTIVERTKSADGPGETLGRGDVHQHPVPAAEDGKSFERVEQGLERHDGMESGYIMGTPVEVSADQYEQRVPAPGMEHLYQAENTVLFKHIPGSFHTHVVCPGVLYGNGESNTGFHDVFAKAWQSDLTTALPVYGSGQNLIPTIHVDDCASYVVHLALTQSDVRYLFATDDSCAPQSAIVQGISGWFATGDTFQSDPLSVYTQQV